MKDFIRVTNEDGQEVLLPTKLIAAVNVSTFMDHTERPLTIIRFVSMSGMTTLRVINETLDSIEAKLGG